MCAVCSRILFNLIQSRTAFVERYPELNFSLPANFTNFLRHIFGQFVKLLAYPDVHVYKCFSCAIGNGRNQYYGHSRSLQGWTFVTNRPDRAWKYQGKTCKSFQIFFFCDSVIFFPDHKTFMPSTKFVVESSEIRTFQLCYNLL